MLEWLNDNWVNILAGIGSLYATARVVVALTPTPEDDAALEKVATWLKTLAKIVGLDITQGINKK